MSGPAPGGAPDGTFRAFLAVEPGDSIRAYLGDCLGALRERWPRVRWTRAENVHVTLKFLGDISFDRADEVVEIARAAVAASDPLRVRLGGPGSFGGAARPRVCWLALEHGAELDALVALQARLEQDLERLGFPREERPWRPHLTVGRNPRRLRLGGWADCFDPRWKDLPPLEATRWTLFASELTPRGAIYRPVAVASAGDPAVRGAGRQVDEKDDTGDGTGDGTEPAGTGA